MIRFCLQPVKTGVSRDGYHLDRARMRVRRNPHHAAENHPHSPLPWLPPFAVGSFPFSFGSSPPAEKLTVVEIDDQVHALVQVEEQAF